MSVPTVPRAYFGRSNHWMRTSAECSRSRLARWNDWDFDSTGDMDASELLFALGIFRAAMSKRFRARYVEE